MENIFNNEAHIIKIASELNLKVKQVYETALLLNEGATVPFIARYRKEATGSLDEVAIITIRDRLIQLQELDKRKSSIINSLKERNLLTEELKNKILSAETQTVLEDIYLPYKPKKRTKATIAKEKGLEPLAKKIFDQEELSLHEEALQFINQEKGVLSVEDALSGARDIIAEWINEDQVARAKIREFFFNKGFFKSKVIPGKEEEGIKYKDYFDCEEQVSSIPSHRYLAMRRGEKELFLTLRLTVPEEEAILILESLFLKGKGEIREQVKLAIYDSFKRLLFPSIETEVRNAIKRKADEEAIKVFSANLRQLLMEPPLGQKNVLAIDPGFRTGCKVVCLNRQGKLLHHDTIYPHQEGNSSQIDEAKDKIIAFCKIFDIEAIAIGNGTAGRETEAFIRSIPLPKEIPIIMVNESGASIYSASEVAREEFPDYDVTVRGSVSIGRRLMDPLAELVKIDPKSIGVGQYQHDVDQKLLKNSLDDVVISCVNSVGVDVNTASKQLLMYVSGLGPKLAQNIVDYIYANGPFKSREEFKNVQGLGEKAFEQSAGFLRIRDGINPLDNTAVHPENYHLVLTMAKDIGCSIIDLMKNESLRKRIDLKKYITDKIGLPTLTDIMEELAKPGRDPRKHFEVIRFVDGIQTIQDLKPGMKLTGIVTNITQFGAFVDIGVHQDGLIHVSQLSDRFIKNPAEVVKVHQKVEVTVLEVDLVRRRIALSMKENSGYNIKAHKPAIKEREKKKDTFSHNPFSEFFKHEKL